MCNPRHASAQTECECILPARPRPSDIKHAHKPGGLPKPKADEGTKLGGRNILLTHAMWDSHR